MRTTRIALAWLLALLLAWPFTASLAAARDCDDGRPGIPEDQVALEYVGQVTNLPGTTDHPLGTSQQYGYFTFVRGIDTAFSGSPANETTARFTFFTDVVTTRVISNGPLRIISREGDTAVYLDTSPASFSNPDSFRAGTLIQASTIQQQVVVDTLTGLFTVVNVNTITSTDKFAVGEEECELGQRGGMYRTTLTGHLNSPAPPSGHFGGYAVGISQ
jgi:hypothetical protein